MSDEVWKDYPEWEGLYQVSSLGRVKSLSRVVVNKRGYKKFIPERLLKLTPNRNGYIMVSLSRLCRETHLCVHFMIAKMFVPNDNPAIKTEVNHLNECKADNRASNLAWVSHSENVKYGTAIKRTKISRIKANAKNAEKSIMQYDKGGTIIARHNSISQASLDTGVSITSINNCLCGRSNSAGGYIWKYIK